MFFGFNWVDLIVIIFLVFYAALIFKRGFIAELFEFLGFALSLAVALFLFPIFSTLLQRLSLPASFSSTASFVVLWILAEVLFLIFLRDLFKKIPMVIILSRFNRYLGLIPNLASSLLVAIFVGLFLVVLPVSSLVKAQVTQSQILGKILPFFGEANSSMEQAFSTSVREGLVYLTSKKNAEKDGEKFINLNFPRNLTLTRDSSSEDQLLVLLNEERRKQKLSQLESDEKLMQIAEEHSRDMFKRSYFGHLDPEGKSPLDRAKAENLSFTSLGENISYAPDATTAHIGFMSSKGHRENILLARYTKVGIGVVDSGTIGKMFTQLFSN